jgi:hypothetical protein
MDAVSMIGIAGAERRQIAFEEAGDQKRPSLT